MNNNTLTPTLAIVKSALALSAMTSPTETPMASTSVRDDVARLAATPSVERLRTTLAQCVVFQGLPPDALEDLVRRMTLRSGAAGTELLCPEEADAGLFIEQLREYPYANGCLLFDGMEPLPGRRFGMPKGVPAYWRPTILT